MHTSIKEVGTSSRETLSRLSISSQETVMHVTLRIKRQTKLVFLGILRKKADHTYRISKYIGGVYMILIHMQHFFRFQLVIISM